MTEVSALDDLAVACLWFGFRERELTRGVTITSDIDLI